MADLDLILEQQEQMETVRGNWEHLWQRVAELVLPRADDFGTKHSPGDARNHRQYDAFPMQALDKFAAGIEAGTMPKTTYWHQLTTGDEDLDANLDVQRYLQELNSILWKNRYSPRGNFASQAHEVRTSLGAFGTGCLLVEGRQGGGLKYKAIHLGEIFISENDEGLIDQVHRKFELTARQAVKIFGKDTPEKIIDKYNSGKLSEKFEFLHCVAPREDYAPGMLDQRGLPFEGVYVFEKQIPRTEGFRSQPYITSRLAVSTREVYGRGPAIQLLPDISMLNEMRRTTIEAANMAVDVPTLQHDDVSEFDLVPGARNPGTLDDNGRPLVMPWQSGARVDIGMEMIADTRAQIDDAFLGIYFRVLLENPNMTATQAMLIAQQQGQMTAPVVSRLQSEWADPMIRRESSILHAQGKHPEMPPVLMEWLQEQDDGLAIRYESPMVRAAKAEESVGILRTFETLAPLAQVDPTIYSQFNTREIAKIVAEVNGVPARALKSEEQIEEEQMQQQAEAQMAQVLEAAPVAADTAKTLTEIQKMAEAVPQAG